MSRQASRIPKRLASGLAAVALATSGLALALGSAPAGATSTVSTNALGGANRYGTAANVALATFGAASNTVILSTGENFPDALAGSSIAGAYPGAMLLSPGAALAPETINALASLHATKVVTLGGSQALSANVGTQLTGFGYGVTNIAGADRYETAAKAATAMKALVPVGTFGGKLTAFLASGANFPDALSVGPAAYARHIPILLTDPNTLSTVTAAAIPALGVTQVVILGGSAAVTPAVETSVKALPGVTTMRVAGADRFGTAAAVGTLELAQPVPGPSFNFLSIQGAVGAVAPKSIELVTGKNFPDALSAAQRGGTIGAPIVMIDDLTAVEAAWVTANAANINIIDLDGGLTVLPQTSINQTLAAANPSGGTATITAVAGGLNFNVSFSTAVTGGGVSIPSSAFTLNNGVVPGPATCGVSGLNAYNCVLGGTVLNPNDIIALKAGTLSAVSGGAFFTAVAFTVPAAAVPAVTASGLFVGGKDAFVTFNKPVTSASFIGAITFAPACAWGSVVITNPGAGAGFTTFDLTGLACSGAGGTVPAGQTMTIGNTVVDLTPAPQGGPLHLVATTLTASPDNTRPSMVAALKNYLFANNNQTVGGITFIVLPTGAAAGVAARNYFIKTVAGPAGTAEATTSVVGQDCTGAANPIAICLTVTMDGTLSVGAQSSALAADTTLSAIFVATSAGIVTASSGAVSPWPAGGNTTTDIEAVVFSKPLDANPVPGFGAYKLDPHGDGLSPAVVGGVFGPFDNAAAPTILLVAFTLTPAEPLVTTGILTITSGTAPVDFVGHTPLVLTLNVS